LRLDRSRARQQTVFKSADAEVVDAFERGAAGAADDGSAVAAH
jgi:hypothetical protein